jgi:hypothetical protein
MKRKLAIALAAILTIFLMLVGCAAQTPQTQAEPEERRQAFGETRAVAEQTGNGYRGGNGNAEAADTDDCAPIDGGTTTADPDYSLSETGLTLSLAGYGAEGALDDNALTLADMLTYAMQDEYLARAEYEWITSEFGSARPFTNIMRAEETHIEALLPLFEAYAIAAPADEGESHAVAVASLTEAYQAGVNAEVNNIAMYETFLDQNLPDNVRTVFESLMRASENHLRAFQNKL